MTEPNVRTGGCLCGAVRFSVPLDALHFSACHCAMCRRWGGGPMLAVDATAPVTWQGEDAIGRYRSSERAERCFCKHCGTSLFYYSIKKGQTVLNLGAFDDQDDFTMESQIFIDEKPPGYSFANETPTLTAADVYALYAADPS
ncbi:GFA family protein [Roseospira goensis]|uniref:CENP-V/GFA domain-containing protein n=1 Tax=Roseospira goensis TaxID=391922 RepID=A0A7W6RXZ7_9PROT|nr:GFA family protein [Roseospira goensis]MBB4284622.1 hypothetical protein [Roseospira goensis]